MRFLLLTLATLFLIPEALASYDCDNGRGRTGFNSGYSQEKSYIDILWANFGDCSDYDPFIENLDVEFSTSATSTFLNCRNLGINHALSDEMVRINRTCGLECTNEGINQGTLNAKVFCGVAQQHQYARAASIPICSQFATLACKQAFDGYVMNNCNDIRFDEPDLYRNLKENACKFYME